MAFEEFDRAGTNEPLDQKGGFQDFRPPSQFQGAFLPELSPNQPRQAPDIFNPSSISALPSAVGARPFTPITPSDSQTFTFRKGEAETGAPITAGQPPVAPQAGQQPQAGGIGSGELFDVLQGMSQQQAPQGGGLFNKELPLGGFAATDGTLPALTPEQAARQEAIGQSISGSKEQQEAAQLIRQAKQETTIRESGAKSAKEKIASSLREQGMTKEDIEGDEGFKAAKTEMEKYQAVNRIQKRETLKRISTERDQKVMSRLTSKEKRNEDGTAKNDAAVAVDFDNFFSDLGPDPQSDKPNSSFLSKSQRKEFERIMNEASRGRVSDAKFKRIAKFQKDIEKKRERTFQKAQAKIVTDKIEAARKLATSKEQREVVKDAEKQISAIAKRLEESFSRVERKDGGLQDQLKDKQNALLEGIANPALAAQTVTDEQIKATIPDATPAELVEIRAGLANGFTLEQMAAK
jgi:hypothetical protein